MWWWITARRVHSVAATVLGGFTLLLLVLQGVTIELPSLLSFSGASIAVALVTPVPVCAGLMLCLQSRLEAAETTGVRPVRAMDTALAFTVTAVAIAVSAVLGAITDASAVYEAGRNTAFLVGLTLCARPLMGPPAVMLPAAWILAVALLGFRHGEPLHWTVIAQPLSAPLATFASIVAFAAGLAAQALFPDPRRTRTENA